MKRSLLITIVVLLMATLFVSCNANKAEEDQLFEVSIEDSARTLQASGVIDVDVETLVWFYKATKTSGGFKTGQKTVETAVRPNAAAGLQGSSLGLFSKGSWKFEFYGYAPTDIIQGAPKVGAKPIFQQENCPATIAAKYTLSVTLERGEGDLPAAKVVFDTLNWFHSEFAGEVHELTLDIFVEGELVPRIADIPGEWTLDEGKAEFHTDEEITLTSEAELSFRVYEGEELIGLEPLVIAATPGMKYTVSVYGDKSGILPVDSTVEVIIDVAGTEATMPITTETAISVNSPASVDKSQEGAATTVTFPAGSFTEEQAEMIGNAVLTIDIMDVVEASEATFAIETNDSAIGAISLKLKGVDTSSFNDKEVTIVTYISPGLPENGVRVLYAGEGGLPDPDDVLYDPLTGRLSFTTTHFSDYVIYSGVAFNVETKVVYTSLQDAITAAQLGQTVKLLKDVSVSSGSFIGISNSLTLDGNDKTIEFSANRGIRIQSSNVDVELRNLKLKAKSGYTSFERAVQVDSNNTGVSLVVDNCEITSTDYAINFCAGTTVNLTVRNSTISGWAAINAYGTGNVINVYNSTLEGINDKGYNAEGWNDFATICLEGDTTGHTTAHSSDYVVLIEDSTIKATQTTGNHQFAFGFNSQSINSSIEFKNCEFVIDEGCYFGFNHGTGHTVIVDGKTPAAIAGGIYYRSFAEAISNAETKDTVYLLSDVALENNLTINKALTIEGDGHAVISGKSITTTADVTFKNLIYQNPTNAGNNASMFYGYDGTTELVFEGCTFANPQWEVVQYTSKDMEKLVVKNCTFTAANVAGVAEEQYGSEANEAIRYLHVQPKTTDNVEGVDFEITGNSFENCDKVKDSICGFYYIEGELEIGGNTFADWAATDVVEGYTGKLSIHWPENEELKEVAKWTGDIETYAIYEE